MAVEELTAEQQAAVERRVDTQTIVVGGPGTGKTYTLAARVKALLDRGELEGPDDLLVLSFTRIAVRELSRRLADHPRASLVLPVTIDGYAREVLARAGAHGPYGDFNSRITAASELLDDDCEHRHVIVDEAQDLVEPRLTFIIRLLGSSDGFTVFGAPAEGIYGFQSNEDVDALAALERLFPDSAVLPLSHDHRARTSRASPVRWAGDELAGPGADRQYSALIRALRDAQHVSVDALAVVLRHGDEGSAVACRTGGEVLIISQALHEQGIHHRVQPGADDALSPDWVARTLARFEREELSRSDFDKLADDRDATWRAAAWTDLVRVAGDTDGAVRIGHLRRRLAGITEAPGGWDSLPVVATIHRIKGLEFDRVFVLEPEDPRDDADRAAEARILYVAMTRARDETLMLERPTQPFTLRKRAGRWVAMRWPGPSVSRVEVRVGDVDRMTPFTEEGSAAYIQRHLRTKVSPGDRVVLEREERFGATTYVVMHKGLGVASTTNEFGAALERLAISAGSISDLYIGAVSSSAGDPEVCNAVGLGPGGFWLVPEVSGFGKLL